MMKCPFCGEMSFAKKKNIMDGWSIVKTVEVCALCGKELPQENETASDNSAADRKRASLAALLGGEELEKVSLSGGADADFCHNCIHFIEHPFNTRCGLTGASADPMGSCEKFSGKK